MDRTLSLARRAFIDAIARDTQGTDRARFLAVLDALIAWSVLRPRLLAFKASEGRPDVVSFERVGPDGGVSPGVFWSAQVTRGAGPKLELHVPRGRQLSDEERATALETLNAHSREVRVKGDRLRIGFGALKNEAARAAVFALMQDLLSGGVPAAP